MGNNNRVFTGLLTIAWAFLCAAIVPCMGCGGGGGQGAVLVGADGSIGAVPVAAADLPVPDGVDPGVWSRIIAEFTALDTGRAGSAPPLNTANRIDDLILVTEGEGAPYLTWSYRNLGDYDLNGLVNASDLTPIGLHYGKTTAAGDWDAAQIADGSGDGEIGIGDITPIGQNYLNRVVGYLVESSADGADGAEWAEAARVTIEDLVVDAARPLPHFRLATDALPAGEYLRVTPFCYDTGGTETEAGIAGTAVQPAVERRGDWWMEGRDNYHSSVSSFTGPVTNHLWWSLEIAGIEASGPVVDCDGRIFIGGADGLYIIDPDGSRFRCCTTADAVTAIPAMALDGTVYVGCNDGLLCALSPAGSWKWTFQAAGPLTIAPAVAPDGTIWFTDAVGTVYGLNPDGTLQDQVETGLDLAWSPAVGADGRIYCATAQDDLYVYPGDTGAVTSLGMRWPVLAELPYYTTDAGAGEPGYVAREMLFTGDGYAITALDTGYFADPVEAPGIIFASASAPADAPPLVGLDGTVRLFSEEYCLLHYTLGDSGSNQASPVWQSAEPIPFVYEYNHDFVCPRMTVDAEGNGYFQETSQMLIVSMDAEGGLRWFTQLASTHQPVLAADRTLLMVSDDGTLLAFGGPLSGSLPGPVTELTANAYNMSYSSVMVTWSRVEGAAEYEVFRDGSAEPVHTATNAQSIHSDDISWVDEGRTPGQTYSYQVRGVNQTGPGELSTAVEATTSLQPPADFTATQGIYADRVELSWEIGPNDAGYRIYRDRYNAYMDPMEVLGLVDSWVDTSVTDWDSHVYFLVAFNDELEGTRSYTWGSITPGSGDTASGDWRTSGHDNANRNAAGAAGPAVLNLAWQQPLEFDHINQVSGLFTGPVFGDAGAIYLALVGNGYRLLALNPDGSLRWNRETTCRFPLVRDDGSVVTESGSDLTIINPDGSIDLSSLRPAPGSLIQTAGGGLVGLNYGRIVYYDLAGESTTTVEVTDNVLQYGSLVSDAAGNLYVIERDNNYEDPFAWESWHEDTTESIHGLAADGSAIWSIPDVQTYGTLAVDLAGNLLACYDDALHALNPADGSVLWSYPGTGGLAVDAGGRIIMGGDDGLVVLNADGSEAWTYTPPTGTYCREPIVDAAGTVFINEYSPAADDVAEFNRLVALDGTGVVLWSYQLENVGPLSKKSIRDDGYLIWGAEYRGDDDYQLLLAFAP